MNWRAGNITTMSLNKDKGVKPRPHEHWESIEIRHNEKEKYTCQFQHYQEHNQKTYMKRNIHVNSSGRTCTLEDNLSSSADYPLPRIT